MFGEIKITQLHCYLQGGDWEKIKSFAFGFMADELQAIEEDHGSLMVIGNRMHLRIEEFVLNGKGLPWNYEVSLTIERKPQPFDDWLNLQFTRQLCQGLEVMAFCDPPWDILKNQVKDIKLAFQPTPTGIQTFSVELFERDLAQVEIVSKIAIDLRNLELFQIKLPY
jgi:hypothetical protein